MLILHSSILNIPEVANSTFNFEVEYCPQLTWPLECYRYCVLWPVFSPADIGRFRQTLFLIFVFLVMNYGAVC